jgi:hypothetical protein
MISKCKHKKEVEKQNRKRNLQKEAILKFKSRLSSAFDVEIITDQEMLEQFKAFNRFLRTKARK